MVAYSEKRPKLKAIPTELVNQLAFCSLWRHLSQVQAAWEEEGLDRKLSAVFHKTHTALVSSFKPRSSLKAAFWVHTVQFSHSVLSDSLRPHGLQHASLPCPSPTPELTQTHVHQVSDAVQPSHPLMRALGNIITKKASGSDGIPAELFQIQRDDAIKVLHSICQQIRKTWQWTQDQKRSVFFSFPKKGSAK